MVTERKNSMVIKFNTYSIFYSSSALALTAQLSGLIPEFIPVSGLLRPAVCGLLKRYGIPISYFSSVFMASERKTCYSISHDLLKSIVEAKNLWNISY